MERGRKEERKRKRRKEDGPFPKYLPLGPNGIQFIILYFRYDKTKDRLQKGCSKTKNERQKGGEKGKNITINPRSE